MQTLHLLPKQYNILASSTNTLQTVHKYVRIHARLNPCYPLHNCCFFHKHRRFINLCTNVQAFLQECSPDAKRNIATHSQVSSTTVEKQSLRIFTNWVCRSVDAEDRMDRSMHWMGGAPCFSELYLDGGLV